MLSIIESAVVRGVTAHPVTVETHIGPGLPGLTIVGMPDAQCREIRDRVRAAILTSGLVWPTQRITINLLGADAPLWSGLDLAVAVGVLTADEQIPTIDPDDWFTPARIFGELGLDGTIRPVRGAVAIGELVDDVGIVITGEKNAQDAHVASCELWGFGFGTLGEVVTALRGTMADLKPPSAPAARQAEDPETVVGYDDVLPGIVDGGLAAAVVAAAGGHSILVVGDEGSGTTVVTGVMVGLLPNLDPVQAVEVAKIRSCCGITVGADLPVRPPVQAPHYTTTMLALIGGGTSAMMPGQVTLAHHGMLILRDLPEFAPAQLDALRQPLQEQQIRLSRGRTSEVFPADVLVAATAEPATNRTGTARVRYERRLSGPVLDNLPIRVRAHDEPVIEIPAGATTKALREQVDVVRQTARTRGVTCNERLTEADLDMHAPLTEDGAAAMRELLATGALSARGLLAVRRLAVTIADLTHAIHEDDIDPGSTAPLNAAFELHTTKGLYE